MELRRLLLRLMLAALGIAALAAVLGVVTAAGDVIWRVVGTCVMTAVAVGLMIPCSLAMDKPRLRAGGIAGMAWALVIFFLSTALIWENFLGPGGWRFWERMGLSLLFWILCGTPAVAFFFIISIHRVQIMVRSGVTLAAVTFALFMVGVWHEFPYSSDRWFETAVAVAGFGTLGLLNLVNLGHGDRHFFRWLGIGAALVALAVSVVGIWNRSDSLIGQRILMGTATLAALCALANVVLLVPVVGMQRLLPAATIGAAALCAIALNLMVGQSFWSSDDLLSRLAAGSAIVSACGALALAIIGRLNRREEFKTADAASPISDIALFCPRCGSKQRLALNGASCAKCHLRIEVRVEEPRCIQCGYSLYMLTSDRCPECGTPIGASAAKT